jgi:Tol biopolymer transport system component
MKRPILISCLLLMEAITINAQQSDLPKLAGPYFGEIPPGNTPKLFAPDILVKPKLAHSNIVFSADGRGAYWCYNGLWFSKVKNGFWTNPQIVSFSKEEYEDDAPFISPDGKRLFFASKRPANARDTSRKENVWVVDILDNGWSAPRILPPSVNGYFFHWQVSVDKNGDLYFQYESKSNEGNKRDIYFCKYVNEDYSKPEMLSEMINTRDNEVHPFISPEGDYLLFSRINNQRLKDGRQDISIFISYKKKNGTWTKASNLKEYLKYRSIAGCPIVTRDGKYLFFLDLHEGRYQRFWVSASFIEELRPKE